LVGVEGWNKLEQSEKLSSMVSLLRSYQKEVDRLTNRAKQGEEAFLEVFQVVSGVPSVEEAKQTFSDLLVLVGSAGRLEVQNKKLMHEIEGYKADFKEITSQETTLRKQEDLISQYEQDLRRLTSEGALDAERKVESRFNDELERQAHVIAQLRSEMKKANESTTSALRDRDIAQSHLLNLESRHNRDMHAKQAEVEMLGSELESLSHTIAEQRTLLSSSERSSSTSTSRQLAFDLASGTPTKLGNVQFSNDADFDIEKDLAIERLTTELNELTSTLEIQKVSSQRDALEQETTIENLKNLLSNLPTLEEWSKVQQRVSVLEGLDSYLGVSDGEVGQGIDAILREKLRKFERSNLELKSIVKNLEAQILEFNTAKSTYQLQMAERDSQIARMEDTISKSTSFTSTFRDPSSSNNENMDSMMQVLIMQRDRVKVRLEALESEKDGLAEKLRQTQMQANSLQEDNVKLYQKLRYLQSFPSGNAIHAKSHSAQTSLSSQFGDIESSGGVKSSMVEEKYKAIYEEQVNPFAAFNDREKTKRVENLNPVERLIFSSTSFFLATKNTRMILFGYLVLLHIVVMFISYRSALTNSKCNANAEDRLN
jgi:homeobox protein cut-like